MASFFLVCIAALNDLGHECTPLAGKVARGQWRDTMRRLATTLVVSSAIFMAGSALAANQPPNVDQIMKMVRATVVVPVEWDGTYDVLDTTYDCSGVFQTTSTDADTICGGKDYSPSAPGSPITFDCTGTTTATTFEMTCTGSYNPIADCIAHFDVASNGTISGGIYFIVSVVNVTYTGTDPLCTYLTPTCRQYNRHGTRTGPAPAAYCATPTRRTSWGQVKTFYR